MTGSIKDYTPNFNLVIPEFNIAGWHDYLEENFRSIDALFYNIFSIQNYTGSWKRLTEYTEGQVVFISDATNPSFIGKMYKVLVNHITTDVPFDTFFTANPTYYERFMDASSAQQYANYCKLYAEGTDDEVSSLGITHSCKKWNELCENIAQNVELIIPIKEDIQTVSENITKITTVADNITNINNVSTHIADINSAADNMPAIIAAPTNAQNAANSANLSEDWATKTDGLVDNADYSAKYYALLASQYANLNVGQKIDSTIPLTSAGLHLLDGSLIIGTGSYTKFVDYIADLYNSGSYTNLFTTEANWQTSVTNYGSCGKYIYDSVNNTVRLPKYTNKHGALIYKNSSGNSWIKIYEDGWCEQGNITSQSNQSTVTLLKSFVDTNYDVLITTNDSTYANYSYACAVAKTTSTFNISVIRSGSGITALVYWEAKGYVDVSDYQKAPIYEYVVVATSTKTNIEVDIDQIATDLNGKADVDLSNCTKPHVVETYSSGTDWYRIWSDGWCEQGGICGDHSTNSLLTVNLLVEYANTNYHVSKNYNGSNKTTFEDDEGSFFNKTTTTMQTYCRGTSDIPSGQYSTWEAKGYIS